MSVEQDLHQKNVEYMEENWYWFLAQGLVKAIDVAKLYEAKEQSNDRPKH